MARNQYCVRIDPSKIIGYALSGQAEPHEIMPECI